MDGPAAQPLPFVQAPSLTLFEDPDSPVSLSWQTDLSLCQLPVTHLFVHGKINLAAHGTRIAPKGLEEVTDVTFDEVLIEKNGIQIPSAPKIKAFRYLSSQRLEGSSSVHQLKTIYDFLALAKAKSLRTLCLSFPNMPDSQAKDELSSPLDLPDRRTARQNDFLASIESEEFITRLPKTLASLSLTGDFSHIVSTVDLAHKSLKGLRQVGVSDPKTYVALKKKYHKRIEIVLHPLDDEPEQTRAWNSMKVCDLNN
ncbi:hypothetical protein BDP81DRAFT_511715 [Colletotrichum phormii]|uniref:Uncharacterized protein n=1 Tax=Colletotrichum phormii TaxID=359342 RepID=A0AAI9ZDY2_9PEZI|nr:uncharacterized protein BDP81DRAFT_511715 [Colletotrichum phormii]KAK1621654.1 hypothetical protein BDP81DRAFT_511715 [Colletotrichum phormii]